MSDLPERSLEKPQKEPKTLTIRLSWKFVSFVLLLLLAALVLYTKPWEGSSNPRTITIDGETVLKAEPDEFMFYSTFEDDSLEANTKKANDIFAGLKALGLADDDIQLNSSSYPKFDDIGRETENLTYSTSVNITVSGRELSQKVQDYLLSQNATGQLTPSPTFSREKLRQLKDEASVKAVEDAKKRAETTANNLGVKLGKVRKIEAVNEQDQYYPMPAGLEYTLDSTGSSYPVTAGDVEFPYVVKVEFEIR